MGFFFGFVIGGVLIDVVGWWFVWYMYVGICFCLFFVGLWVLFYRFDKLLFSD